MAKQGDRISLRTDKSSVLAAIETERQSLRRRIDNAEGQRQFIQRTRQLQLRAALAAIRNVYETRTKARNDAHAYMSSTRSNLVALKDRMEKEKRNF